MTVKIHIPSSESPTDPPRGDNGRPAAPGPVALMTAGLVAVSALIVIAISVVSGGEAPSTSVPAPFEPSEPETTPAADVEVWTERSLPGDGEIVAMGTVAETPVAVVRSWPETYVWKLSDRAWRVDGSTNLVVESAVVMDDRILLLADQGIRPTVWEWVDGAPRYVFQPTSGSIVGMWSVGGRLLASVSPSAPEPEQTIRSGRSDVLWMESDERDFDKLTLVGIESVLAVAGDVGRVIVGGRDETGVAAVGFVQDDRVLANPVPGAPPLSAVTDFAGVDGSLVARLSVANRRRGTHDEIRSARRDWGLVANDASLVGVEVIDDVVVGVTQDGSVVRYSLDGEELPAPPSPPWSFGYVLGLARLGDEPVAFGQSANASPVFAGPSIGSVEVVMPIGRWERYHSEAADGFHLVHVGSLEFATRDGELFYRAWNGDRWHPAESDGALVMYGTPRILELDWGHVLIPSAGGGLWSSVDGTTWDGIDGSDTVRIDEVATDGSFLVGVTRLGALGGPTSLVTVVLGEDELASYSLEFQVVGLVWEEGVGFVASVVPPGSGYATSPDGLEWTRHDGVERFGWVVAFDGSLYLGTGEPLTEGDPPVETPGGEGWLSYLGETLAFQSGTGAMWFFTGEEWVEADFGLLGGLPGRPETVVVRGSRAFAMVEGVDGAAETYVLELD